MEEDLWEGFLIWKGFDTESMLCCLCSLVLWILDREQTQTSTPPARGVETALGTHARDHLHMDLPSSPTPSSSARCPTPPCHRTRIPPRTVAHIVLRLPCPPIPWISHNRDVLTRAQKPRAKRRGDGYSSLLVGLAVDLHGMRSHRKGEAPQTQWKATKRDIASATARCALGDDQEPRCIRQRSRLSRAR